MLMCTDPMSSNKETKLGVPILSIKRSVFSQCVSSCEERVQDHQAVSFIEPYLPSGFHPYLRKESPRQLKI